MKLITPDSLLIFSLCFIYGLSAGLRMISGIFFIFFQYAFNATAAEISFVMGLTGSVAFIGGPIYAVLYKLIGPKKHIGISALFLATAHIGSALSQSYFTLMIFQGVFLGIGNGMCYLGVFTIIGQTFHKKRSFVNNIVISMDLSIGIVLAPLIQYAIPYYTWRGCLLLQGGLVLNILPLTWLAEKQHRELHERQKHNDSKSIEMSGKEEIPENSSYPETESKMTKMQIAKAQLNILFDASLLRDPVFWIFCISTLGLYGIPNMTLAYVIRYAQDIGIDDQVSANLMSVFLALSFVLTIIIGVMTLFNFKLAKKLKISKSNFLAFLATVQALVMLMPTIWTTTEAYTVYLILLGLLFGGVGALPTSLLPDFFGPERMAGAIGFRFLISGFMVLLVHPFIGTLIDMAGNYKPAQYVSAIVSVMGGAMVLFVQWRVKKRKKLTNTNQA